jgi:hypothetical protein
MEFSTHGYSLQESEERLFTARLATHLLNKSKSLQLVQRNYFDTLLEELDLGSSKLADPEMNLDLGKIRAARLILSGQIIFSGPETQVSIRLIETETGRETVIMNESKGTKESVSKVTEKLSVDIFHEINKFFPLRGKILGDDLHGVKINIGQNAGVEIEQRFKGIDEDFILEVISIQPNISVAKIIEGAKPIEQGQRLEIIP